MRRVEALLVAAPPPTRPQPILVACPPSETHSFNLLLLTYLLRRRGWRVVYLGADTPLERIGEAVETVAPGCVVSAAQYLPAAEGILHLARVLAQRKIPLGFGGLAFNWLPALRARIPGHFLGERLEEALDRLEALMGASQPAPEPVASAPGFADTLRVFREREVVIRGQVWRALQEEGIADDRLIPFGRELGLHLRAALALGELGLVEAFLKWVRGCRQMGWLSEDLLGRYLAQYAEAMRKLLGGLGASTAAWLETQVEVA